MYRSFYFRYEGEDDSTSLHLAFACRLIGSDGYCSCLPYSCSASKVSNCEEERGFGSAEISAVLLGWSVGRMYCQGLSISYPAHTLR